MIHWERHGKSSSYLPFIIKASKPTQRYYLGHHYELKYSNNHVTDDQANHVIDYLDKKT